MDTTPRSDTEGDYSLSTKLHDLRTPLNHIIGLSEMLMEIAEEYNDRFLLEGFQNLRHCGLEITKILQDSELIPAKADPGHEYWRLADAVCLPISTVLGFTDLLLADPTELRLSKYRDDLSKVRSAARHLSEIIRGSRLLIRREVISHERKIARTVREPEALPIQNARVLVVDDEAINRELLCRQLRQKGYHPTEATSGPEALRMAKSEPFDAILLDLLMPGVDGIEVLRTLKGDTDLREIPVIMLSALIDVERVARCVELGAEDYIIKPINSVLLQARLGACLEKKSLRDQEREHLRALHAEKERLSVTLRSLAEAVITTDGEGKILLFNDVAAELAGESWDAAYGKRFDEVFHLITRETGEPLPALASQSRRLLDLRESVVNATIRLAGAEDRSVAVRSAPIRGAGGELLGMVVVMRDVTGEEKMAAELLQASKLQSVGVLAGGLAHDYNNMLTAVLGNLSLMRQRDHAPDMVRLIDEAERGAERAQELTRYLLTFAHGGAPIKQALDIGSILQDAFASALSPTTLRPTVDLAPHLWEVHGDSQQLTQLLNNLLINAEEAEPRDGDIRVRVENAQSPLPEAPNLPEGNYIAIRVRDTGKGIDPEHLPRIFDPFFTTKQDARGLGLAVAYSIVTRHGGHIAADSIPGDGTTVTLYLPAQKTPTAEGEIRPADTEPPHEEPSAPQAGNRRVLVMDDEEPIRLLAETMLQIIGYEVITAPDGETAVAAHAEALASGNPFGIAVMDLTIPGGMGGREAIRRVREKDRALYAIVSSGYSNDPVMADFAQHGFDAVLPKPYTFADFAKAIRQAHQV